MQASPPTAKKLHLVVVVVYVVLLAAVSTSLVRIQGQTEIVSTKLSVHVRHHTRAGGVETVEFTGARGEMVTRHPIMEMWILVTMVNNGADCLECYADYTITEGGDTVGDFTTKTIGGMNTGLCVVSKGEEAGLGLFFTPQSTGNITVIISYEARYEEWGNKKTISAPKQEVTIAVLPPQPTGVEYGEAMILAAGLLLFVGIGIIVMFRRRQERELATSTMAASSCVS